MDVNEVLSYCHWKIKGTVQTKRSPQCATVSIQLPDTVLELSQVVCAIIVKATGLMNPSSVGYLSSLLYVAAIWLKKLCKEYLGEKKSPHFVLC